MGSTGEADRKRRHLSSISPTSASAMANKSPFSPLAEDRKLDTTVLQYQNQKVSQKLEVQKVEILGLENKLSKGKEKQQPYEKILTAVNKSWNELISDLEARSVHTKDLISSGENVHIPSLKEDGASSSSSDTFINRLVETDSSGTCLPSSPLDQMIEDEEKACEKSRNILHNIVTAVDELWRMKDGLYATMLMALPEDGSGRKMKSNDLAAELKKLRSTLSDLHIKHRSLARELRKHQDSDAKNKAELKYLQGDLESTVRELEESNLQLAALKAEKDATKGTFFPMLNTGTKPINDREGDSQKDIQDMELALKESMDQSTSLLQELKQLHEDRIEILIKLSNLQGSLKNVKSISSSRAFKLVNEELEKTKADFRHYQALYEKLQSQVVKDKLLWKEREANVLNDLCDVHCGFSASSNSRIDELQTQIQQPIDERKQIETKLETASVEPGRKEIISSFKEFISSFPDDMSAMQSKLRKYKETAADIHSLRAEVGFLLNVLARKANELESLSSRSLNQDAEIQRLQAVVKDLKESESELKLILEMYRRESTLPRDFLEVRDREYKAWAHVHSLRSSLDEHNMESRVKSAIEAEALSQQRLASAEAEIACLREKCEFSVREKSRFSSDFKSKHEENEAYLSEIETIGQAYDDMQNQNQHLLQQITERDDYNIKLEQELLRAEQTVNSLQIEKQTLDKKVQQATVSPDFLEMKAARIEDQVKSYSDQVYKLAEDRCQNSVALENIRRKLLETRKSNQQARESLEESQTRVKNSRMNHSETQIELEKQRFERRRLEEELEGVKRKAERLTKQKEGSIVEKLCQELQEYKEILKCTACLDRPKEVVITKCYHLLCNPCVQREVDGRHRKCPVCSASFGPNDVKPVYI